MLVFCFLVENFVKKKTYTHVQTGQENSHSISSVVNYSSHFHGLNCFGAPLEFFFFLLSPVVVVSERKKKKKSKDVCLFAYCCISAATDNDVAMTMVPHSALDGGRKEQNKGR